MLSIKSNIDGFLKEYKRKTTAFRKTLISMAEKLAARMSEDMAYEITSLRYIWEEEGNLSDVSNIDFKIMRLSNTSVSVSIGENLSKFIMDDGTEVNPVYFIEFGFGIEGEENPKQNYKKYDWVYNVNQHKKAWYYYGRQGELLKSKGREGINFMYNTIQKYKANWNFYFKELLNEVAYND